jgi:hypothetical protein
MFVLLFRFKTMIIFTGYLANLYRWRKGQFTLKSIVIWDVMPWGLVGIYWGFVGIWSPNLQRFLPTFHVFYQVKNKWASVSEMSAAVSQAANSILYSSLLEHQTSYCLQTNRFQNFVLCSISTSSPTAVFNHVLITLIRHKVEKIFKSIAHNPRKVNMQVIHKKLCRFKS